MLNLFKIGNNNFSKLQSKEFLLEKDIQNIIENNIEEIFGYQLVKSEFPIGGYRIDTLCYDIQNNSFVIIEYKKGKNYSVFDQGMHYLSLVTNNKAECVMEYNEQQNANFKRSDIDWNSLKIIFVSPYFNDIQKGSVNFKDMNFFELWEIEKFDTGIISLNQIKTTSREPINKKISTSNKNIDNVFKEVKTYSEEEWIKKTNEKIKNVWENLKEKISIYDNTDYNTKKLYTSFRKGNQAVFYATLYKSKMDITFNRGNENPDGSFSKNFFTIDDPKNKCKEKYFTYKNGVKGHDYVISLNDISDIEYLEFLIKQKYNSI